MDFSGVQFPSVEITLCEFKNLWHLKFHFNEFARLRKSTSMNWFAKFHLNEFTRLRNFTSMNSHVCEIPPQWIHSSERGSIPLSHPRARARCAASAHQTVLSKTISPFRESAFRERALSQKRLSRKCLSRKCTLTEAPFAKLHSRRSAFRETALSQKRLSRKRLSRKRLSRKRRSVAWAGRRFRGESNSASRSEAVF